MKNLYSVKPKKCHNYGCNSEKIIKIESKSDAMDNEIFYGYNIVSVKPYWMCSECESKFYRRKDFSFYLHFNISYGLRRDTIQIENNRVMIMVREGFDDIDILTNDQIQTVKLYFLDKGIKEWKKVYWNTYIMDGLQWEIEYFDGLNYINSYGSNQYPNDDDMYDFFIEFQKLLSQFV